MKIAYYSQNSFSDVDLSLLMSLKKYADVYYIIPLRKGRLKGTAINIKQQYGKTGLFKASVYPELAKFAHLIDLDKMYVLNCCSKSGFSLKHLWVNILFFKFLLKNKFDIIQMTMFPCYFEFLLYFLRQKIVLTVHDPLPHSSDISFINHLYRKLAFGLIPNLIILNKAQKKKFVQRYHLEKKNIFESRLSCYTYLRMYDKISSDNVNARYILFYGRITSYKGLDYLFPAMKEVHKIIPDVKLIVAGKGNFHFDISEYQDKTYIEIRNYFIDDKELAILIQNSLFVVCPYIDATQSGVIMSAYAFCKPVIATNVGGLPEMVLHNKFGLIIPSKNVDRLKDAIIELLGDEKRLAKFKENINHEYFTGKYSWDNIAHELLNIYQQILPTQK